MEAFASLLDALSTTPSRTRKLTLLVAYLRGTPDPDRGYALAALTDGVPVRLPLRRTLLELMASRIDPELYRLSRDYVGDTAETVALLWPASGRQQARTLGALVGDLIAIGGREFPAWLAETLDSLDARGRWALLKLIGGAARVGVSARLAKTAAAEAFGRTVEEIEEIWPALQAPYRELFDWLERRGPRPDAEGRPQFRPMMLASPLEPSDHASISQQDFAAEWKWDGIRVQVVAGGGVVRLFSRTGDDISAAFPDVVALFADREVTLDGELLVLREGAVAPFNDLQQRLNRKAVTGKLLRDHPAHVRAYDLLLADGVDHRAQPFEVRRRLLEAWVAAHARTGLDVSPMIPFDSLDQLASIRARARDSGIEGLMLKRKSSPYLAGRVKGHWYKWKRDALVADCVLMYAQRGSGKRSSFYSDFTFGAWRAAESGAEELVPVGKAYSGFSDEELRLLDRFVRQNTLESYGPVRAVKPLLVLEVAFDAVQRSSRHKSGIAMRFPRIHRVRWDKPAAEADRVEAIARLIEGNG